MEEESAGLIGYYASNYQPMDATKIKLREKILRTVTSPESVTLNALYLEWQLFSKIKC
jgi:hypothetical protein